MLGSRIRSRRLNRLALVSLAARDLARSLALAQAARALWPGRGQCLLGAADHAGVLPTLSSIAGEPRNHGQAIDLLGKAGRMPQRVPHLKECATSGWPKFSRGSGIPFASRDNTMMHRRPPRASSLNRHRSLPGRSGLLRLAPSTLPPRALGTDEALADPTGLEQLLAGARVGTSHWHWPPRCTLAYCALTKVILRGEEFPQVFDGRLVSSTLGSFRP